MKKIDLIIYSTRAGELYNMVMQVNQHASFLMNKLLKCKRGLKSWKIILG